LFPTIDNYAIKGQHVLDLQDNPKFDSRDLLAIDISRGRDVGLQPYNRVRHLCGYPLAKDFEDLADLLHTKVGRIDYQIIQMIIFYYHVGLINIIFLLN
jgi:hypothetical protein